MKAQSESSRPSAAMVALACSLLTSATVIGCAAPEYAPVADPTARVEGPGFSVLPPPGTGWYQKWVMMGDTRVLSFNRQGSPGSASHTVTATALRGTVVDPGAVGFAEYASDPEVFAAFIKKSTEVNNPPGGRMRALEHTVTPATRHGHCAMEYSKWEDQGSKVISGPLIQQDWQLACLHPDSTHDIIHLVVSERGHPGETDPSLEAARDAFFDNLQFRPLN